MDLFRSNWDIEDPDNPSNCDEPQKTQNNDPVPLNSKTALNGIYMQLFCVAVVLLIIFAIVLPLGLVLSNIKT